MNNKKTLKNNNKSLTNICNELSETYKIKNSVSDSASLAGGTLGVSGGLTAFVGTIGLAGYMAYQYASGNLPASDMSLNNYLGVVVLGCSSVPIGFMGYLVSGAVGNMLGAAYGVVKNSITHGPIKTYKALRHAEA